MKLRLSIAALAAVILVTGAAVLYGCSKDKGTNPTPDPDNFDSGTLSMGVPFTHTFKTDGTFNYRCKFHAGAPNNMTGKVVVDPLSANTSAGVNVADFSFSPATVTIKTGSTVTWTLVNGTHTVTRP